MARGVLTSHPRLETAHHVNGAPGPWSGDVFVFPTTFAQRGFWYLDQLDPGNPAYNIAVRFRLQGLLHAETFERALNEIVGRHETLRTVFAYVDGEPVQVVAPLLSIPLPIIDLSRVPAVDRHACSETLVDEEARRRFTLSTGPLIRFSLLRLDEQDHILLITIHHIISDGWSVGVIARELGTLYDAYRRGLDSPLPDLPLQYGDLAIWQDQWLKSREIEARLTDWTRRLSDAPRIEIPTDRPRLAFQSTKGQIRSVLLSRNLTEALRDLCVRDGVTYFMLSLATLKVLIQRRTGQNDLSVGTIIGGRSRVDLESMIGPLINPLVLRTDLSGDPPFTELLARVRETVLHALSQGDVPFDRIVEAVQPRRERNRHPLFQINFIYQRDFVRPFHTSGLTLTAIPSKSPGAIYDLNFFMVEREDGWRFSCEYNTDLYESVTAERLLANFQALLEGIADNPTRRISELPMSRVTDHAPGTPSTAGPGSSPVREPRQAAMRRPEELPPDETETRLLTIWGHVLGQSSSGIDDDFFDAGGHSLLAMRFLGQIERTLGKRVSLATFLQAPTIRSLAECLREETSPSRQEQVIVTHPEGSKVPFVLVDTGPYFRPLFRRLGKEQPVFGLTLPELPELPKRFTVRDIAANLIEALHEVQPHGPYYLGGWCHAGVIAYEMAQLLRGRGEHVALLILFDTNNPRYVRSFKGLRALPVRLYLMGAKLRYHFSNLRRMKSKGAPGYARQRIQTIGETLRRKFWQIWYRGMNRAATEHLRNSSVFQYLAVDEYEPGPSDTPMVLFRSQVLQTGRFRDPQLGWGDTAQAGLSVHEMPGNHAAMFIEPIVNLLAGMLATYLPQAENRLGNQA